MAFSAKTNQLTGPAATGNDATTDPGFQPKALIVWNGLQTATGATADAQWSLGVASSTTTETSAGYNVDDNVATSDASRSFNTARTIVIATAGTTTNHLVADLNSFDATGFTQNWTTLTTASPLYNYLALGGSDITNVKSGNFTAATTGATQAVTGIGFQPDVIFLFTTLQATSALANNNNQYGYGVATATSQWTASARTQNAQATMNTTRGFSNTGCLQIQASASNIIFHKLSLASMDSDGFTFNIDTQGGSGILIGYLAIKGGQWAIGTSTSKTTADAVTDGNGLKTISGLGFTPEGAMFGGTCDTQTDGTADHSRLFFGTTTGSSNNVSLWTGDRDNVADSISNTIMSSTKCITMATEATSASPTTIAEANTSSFSSGQIVLDWTTTDISAQVFGYIIFGANAVASTTIAPTHMMTGMGG